MIPYDETLDWLFSYTGHKFQGLRATYSRCTLKVDVAQFPEGTRIDEIQVDYQYGIMDFIRTPVSSMDKHETLASFTLILLVEGLDYRSMEEKMEKELQEAIAAGKEEELQEEPPSLFEVEDRGGQTGFMPAEEALARLNSLPDYTQGFVKRDPDDTTPVNG